MYFDYAGNRINNDVIGLLLLQPPLRRDGVSCGLLLRQPPPRRDGGQNEAAPPPLGRWSLLHGGWRRSRPVSW